MLNYFINFLFYHTYYIQLMSTKKYHLKCIDNYNNYVQNGGLYPFQSYPISTLQQRIGHSQTQIPFGYSQTRPNTSLQYQIPVPIIEQPKYDQPLVPPTSGSTLLHTLDVSDASSYNMSKIPLSPKGHPTIVPLNMTNNIQSPPTPITPTVVAPVIPVAQGLPFFSVINGINNASFVFTPFNNIISPFGNEPEQKFGKQNVDGKIFTGAGIMLFESIGDNIVLFKSRKTGEFEELGGRLNENDVDTDIPRKNVLIKVAKREAYEESACYVDIENDNLRNAKYVTIKKGDDHYRCFIQKLKSVIIINDIAKNFEIIRNSARTYNAMNVSTDNIYSKPSYMEMIGVARFSINALKEAIINSDSNDNIKCKNLDGDVCSIRDRTVALLKKMIVNDNNYQIIKKKVSSTIETLKIDNGLTTLKIK